MDNIFLQISALLGLTVSIAFIVRLLRQPLLIAYIVAGIVAGPLFLNVLYGDGKLYHAFSEFGIVLLLFLVGLSLNFDHIKKIGKTSLSVGLIQFFFTAGVGYAILRGLDFAVLPSLYVAAAITFSSTIIIVKLLNDKKDTQSVYGRHVIGLMVVQDLIAIAIMLGISSVQVGGSWAASAGLLAGKFVVLTVFVYLVARFVLPRLLNHVAKSSEFLFIFTIAWCFGVASLLHWIGFSLEIGAIIAGLSLGSSPYQPEISSRIRPLRDFFIVMFFIILGSQMQLADIRLTIVPAIILSTFVLIGDPLILFLSFRSLKFTRRNSFLSAVTAAHVSEFGFILLFTGMKAGHLVGNELSIFTMVALATIMVSTYGITYNEQLYRFLIPLFDMFGKDKYQQKEEKMQTYDVWVFGYHRIGSKVCHALQKKGVSFAVVDFDPHAISQLQARGIPAYFGDAGDVEFLAGIALEKAKLIISTLPEVDDQLTLIKFARVANKKVHLIVNLYHHAYLEDMYEAGADYVMMPHLLGGNWVADMLRNESWNKKTFDALKHEQRQELSAYHA